MVIRQGEVWWADLLPSEGSTAAFTRPVVVVQDDAMNDARVPTVVCVPLTSNLAHAGRAGNLPLTASRTGLPKDSVAQAYLIHAVDRAALRERVGHLSDETLRELFLTLDVVLGR